MSSDRDVSRTVRSWMEEGVTALPDRVLDAVLEQIPATPQRRAWWLAWRFPGMKTLAKLAIAAAAVVVVAVVGINLLSAGGGFGRSGPALSPTPTPTPSPTPSPTPTLSPPATPAPRHSARPAGVNPVGGDLTIGRHSLTVDGVPFSFSVPASRWEPFGSLLISKSTFGPQGAEAVIFWASFPDGVDPDPCANLLSPPVGPSAADLAAAVSTAPGAELVTGLSDVRVGGRAAKHVVLTVRQDGGCDPGFFYNWKAQTGGAMWETTDVGDTIRVWIVDVDGKRLFIEGETSNDAGLRVEREIEQIVESIQFE
ncbi:MAG: hypothetical protein M3R49_03330 [Chloroflexota bacterium]|nr:hypothetical protein [Chloroflexota bacterium]